MSKDGALASLLTPPLGTKPELHRGPIHSMRGNEDTMQGGARSDKMRQMSGIPRSKRSIPLVCGATKKMKYVLAREQDRGTSGAEA